MQNSMSKQQRDKQEWLKYKRYRFEQQHGIQRGKVIHYKKVSKKEYKNWCVMNKEESYQKIWCKRKVYMVPYCGKELGKKGKPKKEYRVSKKQRKWEEYTEMNYNFLQVRKYFQIWKYKIQHNRLDSKTVHHT